MKKLTLLFLVLGLGWAEAGQTDQAPRPPAGKLSFDLSVPQESAAELQAGQRVSIKASNGRGSKRDSAPILDGTIVLSAPILYIGKKVFRDGSVILVLSVDPSEEEKLKIAVAQKAELSIKVLPMGTPNKQLE